MSGLIYILGASVLWGMDALVRYPLLQSGISATKIVFSEHLILAILFLPIIIPFIREIIWQKKYDYFWSFLVIGGLGSAMATLSFTKAFQLINPSIVIMLQKLQPVVAIVLSHYLLKERITKSFIPWAIVCLVGGMLVSIEDILKINWTEMTCGDWGSPKSILGHGLALLAVIGWGASTVFGKKLALKGVAPSELMAGRFLAAFIIMLPVAYVGEMDLDMALEDWGKILLMVAFSGILAMYLYYQGLKRISAKLCALAEMFFPLSAVIINWIFLDALLTPLQLVGGGILLASQMVIQWKQY